MNVEITDVTLRDGSHAVRHQFTLDQVIRIAGALTNAGVPVIEVSHGDGLGGSSLTYGLSGTPELELIAACAPIAAARGARLAVLLLPGIGVARDLEAAAEIGASVARVATHCTEADIAQQHLAAARRLGMRAVGFLMMAHMISPHELAEQAMIHEAAGAEVVYCTDSAGALTPDGVRARVAALRNALDDKTAVGFHAHNNLGLGVGNTLAAIQAGASHVDASARGLGAGAGNCATEALIAACDKSDIATGVSVPAIAAASEEVAALVPESLPTLDRSSLMLGWAGVYSSFLLHAQRAAVRYGVDEADILIELGRRKAVGGQEDMIVDVALELADQPA